MNNLIPAAIQHANTFGEISNQVPSEVTGLRDLHEGAESFETIMLGQIGFQEIPRDQEVEKLDTIKKAASDDIKIQIAFPPKTERAITSQHSESQPNYYILGFKLSPKIDPAKMNVATLAKEETTATNFEYHDTTVKFANIHSSKLGTLSPLHSISLMERALSTEIATPGLKEQSSLTNRGEIDFSQGQEEDPVKKSLLEKVTRKEGLENQSNGEFGFGEQVLIRVESEEPSPEVRRREIGKSSHSLVFDNNYASLSSTANKLYARPEQTQAEAARSSSAQGNNVSSLAEPATVTPRHFVREKVEPSLMDESVNPPLPVERKRNGVIPQNPTFQIQTLFKRLSHSEQVKTEEQTGSTFGTSANLVGKVTLSHTPTSIQPAVPSEPRGSIVTFKGNIDTNAETDTVRSSITVNAKSPSEPQSITTTQSAAGAGHSDQTNAVLNLALEAKSDANEHERDALGISVSRIVTTAVSNSPPTQQIDIPRVVAQQLATALPISTNGPIELNLSPEELGRVKLTFTPGENGMVVAVVAERPETLELMKKNIDTLAQEFAGIGYEQISFSFGQSSSDSNPNGSPQQGNEQQFSGDSDSGNEINNTPVTIDLSLSETVDIRI